METQHVFNHISKEMGLAIISHERVSGGDISDAYLVETNGGAFFIKTNAGTEADIIFEAEEDGLKALVNTGAVLVPRVYLRGMIQQTSYLVLEYIKPGASSQEAEEELGKSLGMLHLNLGVNFGWYKDNLIGALPQENVLINSWVDFYTEYRLLPQLRLAGNRYLPTSHVPSTSLLQRRFKDLCPTVQPALLHGDLWSGNYLINDRGQVYLIDPSVYYGHSEVDLAMTRLFGGFSSAFYNKYQEIIPMEHEWEKRNDIYQLYYLLVHLNLFGISYLEPVLHILKKYFS